MLLKKVKETLNDIEIEFLPIDKSKELYKKVYKKIDTLNDNVKIDKNINENLKLVYNEKNLFDNFYKQKVILFFDDFTETGAIKINLEVFFIT